MFDYMTDDARRELDEGLDWLEKQPADFDATSEVLELVIRQRHRISIWKMQSGSEANPVDWYTLDVYQNTDCWSFDMHDDSGQWEPVGSYYLKDWDQVVLFVSRVATPSVVLHDL
jgi:hypothetical protein